MDRSTMEVMPLHESRLVSFIRNFLSGNVEIPTIKELEEIRQHATNYFQSLKPKDELGKIVQSQLGEMLSSAIDAYILSNTPLTRSQRDAAVNIAKGIVMSICNLVSCITRQSQDELNEAIENGSSIVQTNVEEDKPLDEEERGFFREILDRIWNKERPTLQNVAITRGIVACLAVVAGAVVVGLLFIR